MAEPIIPRVKTETRTIKSPLSKSSENWWRDIRIRAPYKTTDTAFRRLPSLGDLDQLESFDPGFIDKARGDRARIAAFVSASDEQLDDRQRSNIKKMLERADAYLSDALQIQNLWTSGFTTSSLKVQPWPLGRQSPAGTAEGVRLGHERDADKWKRLVRAAIMNLRCAEEVAKKATIRMRNMSRHGGGRKFGTPSQGLAAPAGAAPATAGKVASGVRTDRLGHHAWSVFYDPKSAVWNDKPVAGYRARIMSNSGPGASVKEEVGVSPTKFGAYRILSDEFNARLLAKYPNEKRKSDPAPARASVKPDPAPAMENGPPKSGTNTASMLTGSGETGPGASGGGPFDPGLEPDLETSLDADTEPNVASFEVEPELDVSLEVDRLESDEDEETSAVSPQKKKSSNTLLVAAAAIAAFFVISKR